jgi:hypothetical protein
MGFNSAFEGLNLVQIYERSRRHVPEGRYFNTEESLQAAKETT